MCLLSSGFQLAQGSLVSVQMMLDPLIGPQENTYVDGVPSDDLTWELDCHADLVIALTFFALFSLTKSLLSPL